MKGRISGTPILIAVLFLAACVLGMIGQRRNEPNIAAPRARWNDATPLGGKGLRLTLQTLGYTMRRADSRLQAMPDDARVWLLLDPQTQFSTRESKDLLAWVRSGGTLIWSVLGRDDSFYDDAGASEGTGYLRDQLGIENQSAPSFDPREGEVLPALGPLERGAASVYWEGVDKATTSNGLLARRQPGAKDTRTLEIAGTPVGPQLQRIQVGKGRVFIVSDALLFTNYALARDDNVVLATNLIRAHVPTQNGAVSGIYFDERQHGEAPGTPGARQIHPNLLYYLWRPPLRYALLQLLGAGLLWWALAGRRLGAPVPLPGTEPVTRASIFALAMGALFRKANRPRAMAAILGENFRRDVCRPLGMSISDSDDAIAQRAAQMSGLPTQAIDRLLLRAKAPAESETEILSDVQEMELVLQRLKRGATL